MSILDQILRDILDDRFEPEVSLKEILIIEKPIFNKVKQALNREFTEEQEKIIKALLFFLKREKKLKVKFSPIEDSKLEISSKAGEVIGSIEYNRFFGADSRSVFNNEEIKKEYINKGLGVLSYVKLAIFLSIKSLGYKSLSSDSPSRQAKKVWLRLKKANLAEEIYGDFVFKDISFLTEKDFKVIDEILNS